MNVVDEIKNALEALALPEKKAIYSRFFKTGKGEYGEGDVFLGVTVPDQRAVAKEFWSKIQLDDLSELLTSPIHEHRHLALLMLVSKYEKSKEENERSAFVTFYLDHKSHINNWDLVDSSCYKILGRHCFENQDASILYALADEENLWSKRIAIVATMFYIKKGQYEHTKEIVQKNLHHSHDLMHKANGWLLREMGNKDERELIIFLEKYYHNMPRTTLRYAIEKLDEHVRQDFLKGKI